MTGNPLKTAIDKQFAGLTKLEELYLGNCEIPSFSATAFKDLTALKTLSVSSPSSLSLSPPLFHQVLLTFPLLSACSLSRAIRRSSWVC